MTYLLLATFGLILFGLLFAGVLLVGLQEAGDPTESRPEDLSSFEKHHVRRSDMQLK